MDTSSSNEVVASFSVDDGFITVISKAQKRRFTEERKMAEIRMAIQTTKTSQNAKKLDPPSKPTNGHHLQPIGKRR